MSDPDNAAEPATGDEVVADVDRVRGRWLRLEHIQRPDRAWIVYLAAPGPDGQPSEDEPMIRTFESSSAGVAQSHLWTLASILSRVIEAERAEARGDGYAAEAQRTEIERLNASLIEAGASIGYLLDGRSHARFMAAGWRRLAKFNDELFADASAEADSVGAEPATGDEAIAALEAELEATHAHLGGEIERLRAEIAALRAETLRAETLPLELAGLALSLLREVPEPRVRRRGIEVLEWLFPAILDDLSASALDRLEAKAGIPREQQILGYVRELRTQAAASALDPREAAAVTVQTEPLFALLDILDPPADP